MRAKIELPATESDSNLAESLYTHIEHPEQVPATWNETLIFLLWIPLAGLSCYVAIWKIFF